MIDISSFTNPGAAGLSILKQTTSAAWLRQPSADMAPFREHKALAFDWSNGEAAPHMYDKNKMHLGAASSALLGVGEPVYFSSVPQAMGREAGLWHIIVKPGYSDTRLPPVVSKPDTWVYTPILQLLLKLGYAVEIKEAFLFPEQHQLFRPFYEEMKGQLEAARNAEELAAVKSIYTVFFGVLAHPSDNPRPGYIYRPDWLFTIVSEAKARMYYNLLKVWQVEHIAPSAIKTDALYYTRPVGSLAMGPNIGQFKYKLLVSGEDE